MTRRAVVGASWYTARSILQNWRPAARWWLLTLECGHEESRRMRYRGIPSAANGTQYAIEQAAPAPKHVDCRKCTQKSGAMDTSPRSDEMTQIMINADRTRDTMILSIQPSVMRVYDARAKELGLDVTELLEGLLADWPAILAPVTPTHGPGAFYTPEPLGAAIESGAFLVNLDHPWGGSF